MKKFLVLLIALSLMVLGANNVANAHSNLIPLIKVDGGWVTVVSYVNTMPQPAAFPNEVYVHATYQVKNPANLLDGCLHLDRPALTTENDLTTTVVEFATGGTGVVWPYGDTVGGAILEPPAVAGIPTATGFLVLENYDSTGALGLDGTLTSEAIMFNLSTGFLYAMRGLSTLHTVASPGGNVIADAPLCGVCNYLPATPFSAGAATVFANTTAGTVTRFMFLQPSFVTTTAYAIALNMAGTAEAAEWPNSLNLVVSDYQARIRLEARGDLGAAYNLGVYNRLENFTSITTANDLVCLAELTPQQLIGAGFDAFITDGGWHNLSPRCREQQVVAAPFTTCNGDAVGTEYGDAAILYKAEFAAGYGFAITPLHQQWFAK